MPYPFLKIKSALFCACVVMAVPVATATVTEHTLANGLKVIVKEDHRAPVAVAQVWYRAGSMDESYGVTGVAHLLEHMMFKGTPTVPTGEFSKRVAALGGRENAFTSRDHTAYFQTVQAGRLEQVMALESDRMAHLTLAEAEFAKEINVVKEERRMRTDDSPQSRLYEQMMATAFVEHPYRHPVIGWMNDLDNMTVADARAWYERWYAPNNATLVVAGDVQPAQVLAWAEQYYGVIPRRALPVRKAVGEPEPQGGKSVVVRAPAKLPAVVLAWPVPKLVRPAEDVEPYALEILAGVLDGHGSARLPLALVKQQRVALDVDTGYDAVARGPAQFVIGITPSEGRSVAEAVVALKAEVQRVVTDGVTEAELARAKAQVVAGQVFQQDSLFYQAMQIGEWETAGLSWRDRGVRFLRLRAVTAEQVRAVAAKYLKDTRLTVAELDPLPMPEGKAAPAVGGAHAR
jgi:zinc protease